MQLESAAFASGEPIPRRYTKDGENVSPPLRWSDVPKGARELALVMEDVKTTGAPRFTHWVIYGIAPRLGELPEGLAHRRAPEIEEQPRQGRNDLDNVGYDGPEPPAGPAHRYRFKLYALDAPMAAEAGLDKRALERRLQEHVLAEAELVGRYERPR